MKIPALVLFVLMYVLMIAKPKYRPCYALVTAAIFLVTGILPFGSLAETINWNVLLMIAGTMIIVYYFIDSRMPNLLADLLLGKSKNVMWVTILMSLFAGLISAFNNIFLLYTIIVWGSVLISAFVDNIPYVATMLPVLTAVTAAMGIEPYLLYFGLLTGATLGGNLTPIGASANITAIGILRKEGYEVGFSQFARIGIPFTLVAVTTGYLITWFVWS
jgi:Na+/H+ antiporter NhaD/arsenite permease-like protein